MPGFFLVLEGTDGSGKTLQTKLLLKRLTAEKHPVKTISFPQYGQWPAAFVERYLRGEFGSLQEVSAEQASLFYALDRYAASKQIRQWLAEEQIVIANRYVSANKGHQLGKIRDIRERQAFLDWINQLEYGLLKNPKPDLTLFLHMRPDIGQRLVEKKGQRAYLQGQKKDIHEADLQHLQQAEEAYQYCLKNDLEERWEKITCFAGDMPRTPQEIHQDIYAVVQGVLAAKTNEKASIN